MVASAILLSALPPGLRDPLIEEYNSIVRNYMERRWSPSELSGGKFCEIVYTIIDGYASGTFPGTPKKPRDFVTACKALESRVSSPRSFQILIPRLLPGLYEIRNNRGVGHAGGDVNPNQMDATIVLSLASWVMAELIRVFHKMPIVEAQRAVDSLVERRLPIVWTEGETRRVLQPGMKLKDQIMLLIGSSSSAAKVTDLFSWTEYGNRAHFNKTLRTLHRGRFIELNERAGTATMLPPGADYVTALTQRQS